jgi:glycosyltransferase involved in cell wall biosynthesis
MLLSILIPVRDDNENLRVCLRSLSEQDLTDCEILVCDDGSRVPVQADAVAPRTLDIRIFHQRGRGPAAARNFLATKAQGQYLFFMDADTVPCHDTVACARRIIAESPGIAAFFGSYDDAPEHPSLISTYRNLLHHFTHQQSAGGSVSTFWCGCGVILRDLYMENGGLSEFYSRPSIEDIELGVRISQKGTKVRIFSDLQVKHRKHWTVYKWLHTDLFCRGIPWVRLMRSNNHWDNQLNFSWGQRIAAMAALGTVGLTAVSPFEPVLLVPAIISLMVFVWMNSGFFGLVAKKRGILDAAAVVLCHLVYALICVVSLFAGVVMPSLNMPMLRKLEPDSIAMKPEPSPSGRG